MSDWERLRHAIRGESLPLAVVDLDALEANAAYVAGVARGGRKTVRVATKSVRSPALLRRIADASDGAVSGLMAYAAGEIPLLAEAGFEDVLVAYPTVQASSLAHVVDAHASIVVDCEAHIDAIAHAARDAKKRVPVVIDVDVSYRPAGTSLHVGVRRSPLREPEEVVALAKRIDETPELTFAGVMLYEAHLAGVDDRSVAMRTMKHLARPRVIEVRARIVEALRRRGLTPKLVNGGGTGTIHDNAREAALTEITAGSAYLASHLFDGYRALTLRPAAFFALEVTRLPRDGIATCHGGGWIASGSPGAARLPVPVFPPGLSLTSLEGAGEVQTPLEVPRNVSLAIGDPVFFRHAKAGELAEHVAEYALVRGDRIIARAPTYRGLGKTFLG
jgi:D-serine deaminase-like pyridoxal phosphate-dependent protein